MSTYSNLDDESIPDHEAASCGGHGTLEARQTVQILNDAHIPCCVCGTAALIFYGALRIKSVCRCRQTNDSKLTPTKHWEICVPASRLQEAQDILLRQNADRFTASPKSLPQPESLAHTYPHFKQINCRAFFMLVPCEDVHLDVCSLTIQKSSNGLPYPSLSILVQSFLDRNDMVSLCDIIDGSNVSEEWGIQNLDLSGFTDVAWATSLNRRIRTNLEEEEGVGGFPGCLVSVAKINTRLLWEKEVGGKTDRLGWTHSRDIFATRFRLHDSPDPWLQHRQSS